MGPYTRAWETAAKPFMTGIITFADEAGGTRYSAGAAQCVAVRRAAAAE